MARQGPSWNGPELALERRGPDDSLSRACKCALNRRALLHVQNDGGSCAEGAWVVVRIRLLGPVDVVVDGEVRLVSGLRRKAVLATLALHGGEVVSTGRLA